MTECGIVAWLFMDYVADISPIQDTVSLFMKFSRVIALVGCGFSVAMAQQIPAFPGAEGYGAYAKGGRGGDVYHVTNLNNSGAGSFADAIATVPANGRTIVFDVSGHIHVNKTTLSKSNVTIAGQTAPGDGIGFKDGTFIISGDDVVIRHARFRYGYKAAGGDCINLTSGTLNAILDHVSLQFSTDENISSFSSPPENLTMQWALNGWGLESHSCGGLWDQNHASAHHSLWAHNHTRNPKARPNGLLEWINNITFDWDIGFIMGDSNSNASWKSNVRGCYFLCPPGNLRSKALEKANLQANGLPNFSLYLDQCLHDNDGDGMLNGTNKGYGIASGSYTTAATPFVATGSVPVTIDPPLLAFKKVLSHAGASRLDVSYAGATRDEVDAKMIDNVLTQKRHHIHKETELGLSNGGFGTLQSAQAPVDSDRDGMPDYYEMALGWNQAVQDHNTLMANSGGFITGSTYFPASTVAGYTRLEEYLHFLSIPHGIVAKNVSAAPTSIQVDLSKFTTGFVKNPIFSVSNIVNGTVALSGVGNHIATFTPTVNHVGRASFQFTVTDDDQSTWTQTCAFLVTIAAQPRDLRWKGQSSVNPWDVSSNQWWHQQQATTFGAGDRVLFDDSGIYTPAISLVSTLLPGTVEVDVNGTCVMSGSGSVSSSGTLTKKGQGTLTLLSGHSYAAGGTLQEGAISLGTGGSLSGGVFSLWNGTSINNNYPTGNSTTLSVPLDIPAGNTATIQTGNRLNLTGALTGSGTLDYLVQTTVTRADLSGPMAGFTGTIQFKNSGGVRMFFNGGSFNGFNGSEVVLTGSVSLQPQTNSGGNTCVIGALSGTSSQAALAGGSAGMITYSVGALGRSTQFDGSITGNAALTKTGSGSLTLTGAHTYTGATSLSTGSLVVNGSLGASAVSVANGASLSGAGVIGGAATLASGAIFSPGDPVGIFQAAGGLSATSATLKMDLSSSPSGLNDQISVTGGTGYLAGTNTFDIKFVDGYLGAGNYRLIQCATGIPLTVGSGMVMNLVTNAPPMTRQSFALTRTSSGTAGGYVQLVVTGNPANLIWNGAQNSGVWDLNATSNFTSTSGSTFYQWDSLLFDDTSSNKNVVLSGSLIPRIITVNTSQNYQMTGTGSLDGTAALVKNGSGTLTWNHSGTNTFTGGVTLNAGTIVLGNDTANASALGTGLVTMNAGTISMFNEMSSYNNFFANLYVPAGASARVNADSRVDVYGKLSGSGTLTFSIPANRTTLFSDWSAFAGTIQVLTSGAAGDFRMGTSYNFPGFPLALVNLSANCSLYYSGILSGGLGTTTSIGHLSGVASAKLLGGPTGGRAITYRIGGRGGNATFAGTIAEQNTSTATSIVKTGAGSWNLTGSGQWAGGTTVEEGTMVLAGAFVCAGASRVASGAVLTLQQGSFTTDALQLDEGASLTGNGTIVGDLTNDGTVSCQQGGTIRITGDVVNNGIMTVGSGTAMIVDGSFVNHGVLDLLTGVDALPANFVNDGIVIDSSSLRMGSIVKSGNQVTFTIPTHSGHNYQLQRSISLQAGTWFNVGAAQSGLTQADGSPTFRSFVDNAATLPKFFYRVTIDP